MHMNTLLKVLNIVLILIVGIQGNAQIVASGYIDQETTSYPTHAENDPIYLFSTVESGSLSATEPDGATSVEYIWYRYNSGSWTEVQSGTEPMLSSVLQENAAYKLIVNDNGSSVGEYECWVFQPELISAEIDSVEHTCSILTLEANVESKDLTYYDLTTGAAVDLEYSLSYLWSSDTSDDISGSTDQSPSIDAPVEDTEYTVSVSAFNGAASLTASLAVEAIAVLSDFSFSATDRGNDNEIQDLDSYEGSAPVVVSLTSEASGNSLDYEWNFLRTDDDYSYSPHIESNTNFTFTEAGTYTVTLTVTNVYSECEDEESSSIEVKEMYVDVPNVFTPNGDGVNDEFMAVYYSVATFKMTVLNRWGRKVFYTTNPGKAWDGKINGRNAAEGVYFYYIDAKGYNDGEHEELKGPVHLIR